MSITENAEIAGRLEEVARILEDQGANCFRVRAYQDAAVELRGLSRSVSDVFEAGGLDGLEKIPGVGPGIAGTIREALRHGRVAMLDRLRGDHEPLELLSSVPGIGTVIAGKLHDDLGIETLEDLASAAHDGRLADIAGLGAKRLGGIRDSLAHRLGRVHKPLPPGAAADVPGVAELLAVDAEYRREAGAGNLKLTTPRRFNPDGEAWLPVLHTTRGRRHYTALFSNTARAHDQGRTRDWVVIYFDDGGSEWQHTVITAEFGRLNGHRIVRGREEECAAYYKSRGELPSPASR